MINLSKNLTEINQPQKNDFSVMIFAVILKTCRFGNSSNRRKLERK